MLKNGEPYEAPIIYKIVAGEFSSITTEGVVTIYENHISNPLEVIIFTLI